MAMSISEFLGTVLRGWNVAVRVNGGGIEQIEGATIADNKDRSKSFDITATNGEVDAAQIGGAIKFLGNVELKDGNSLTNLLLHVTPFDPKDVPEGIHVAPGPDGSFSITDDQGSELGTIDKGASRAEASEAIVKGLGTKAAAGLVSAESKVVPASSEYMAACAAIASQDVDAIVANNEMPAVSGPGSLPILAIGLGKNAKAIKQMKADLTADRQRTLESAANSALVYKAGIGKVLMATDLAKALAEFGYTLNYGFADNSDGGPGAYEILRGGVGSPVAMGRLERTLFAKLPYVDQGELSRIMFQIGDDDAKEVKQSLSEKAPEVMDSLKQSEEAIEEWVFDSEDEEEREREGRTGDPDGQSEGNNNNADPSSERR